MVAPGWLESMGAVVPARAVRLGDAWDDECAVLIDFVRPGGTVCGLGVEIDRIWSEAAGGFMHGPTTEALAAIAAEDPDATVEGSTSPTPVSARTSELAVGKQKRQRRQT